MLLKEMVELGHCLFADSAPSWQESIRLSCKPLEADGSVDKTYAEEIISCVEKYGPYIVLIPNFAMPHCQEGAKGANKTAVSFMKLKRPVSFDPDDPDKDATVFFTVSAVNSAQHLKNMRRLCGILSDGDLCAELLKVTSAEGLLALDQKYSQLDAEEEL